MTETDSYTGANLFVDALETYGVTRLFGNPGTTELPVLRALEDSLIEYVLGLHEDVAVGMAAGYACASRYRTHHDPAVNPLGVVNLHVAPGVAHGLGNVQNAAVSGVPLLVTAGDHSIDFRHEDPILSGDLVAMTEEYTKSSTVVDDVSALPAELRRAVRTALTPPTGPVFLGLPMNVMMAKTDAAPQRIGPTSGSGPGDDNQVVAAASRLVDADDPVLVLGDQVAHGGPDAIDAATALAEATGAAVYSEMIPGEIVFPPDHDGWVSFTPPTEETARAFLDGDVVVFVGCTTNMTYVPYDTPFVSTSADLVHVNTDPDAIGKHHPVDVGITADPGDAMATIAAKVDGELGNAELDRRRGRRDERRAQARERVFVDRPEQEGDGPVSKALLIDDLVDIAPDAFVVNESNTSKYALLTRWALGPEQFFANKNGGLGYGLPATVGAAVAHDEHGIDQPVVGFVGDGSYLYYPQSLYSAARRDLDLTVVVPDNRNYRILKDGMLDIYGGTDEDYEYVGMVIDPPFDIPGSARNNGARGWQVDDPDSLRETLREAVEADGPAVVDVPVRD